MINFFLHFYKKLKYFFLFFEDAIYQTEQMQNTEQIFTTALQEEQSDRPPQYEVGDIMTFSLEDAYDYCYDFDIPVASIKKYEFDYDEENPHLDAWIYDEWTCPFAEQQI